MEHYKPAFIEDFAAHDKLGADPYLRFLAQVFKAEAVCEKQMQARTPKVKEGAEEYDVLNELRRRVRHCVAHYGDHMSPDMARNIYYLTDQFASVAGAISFSWTQLSTDNHVAKIGQGCEMSVTLMNRLRNKTIGMEGVSFDHMDDPVRGQYAHQNFEELYGILQKHYIRPYFRNKKRLISAHRKEELSTFAARAFDHARNFLSFVDVMGRNLDPRINADMRTKLEEIAQTVHYGGENGNLAEEGYLLRYRYSVLCYEQEEVAQQSKKSQPEQP